MRFDTKILVTLLFWLKIGDCSFCNSNLVTGPDGVADSSLSASSYHSDSYCHPVYARIDAPAFKSWCAATQSSLEYLQIRFSQISWLRAFTTLGRGNSQYIKSFHLKVSNDGLTWTYVRDSSGSIKVYTANSDSSTLAKHIVTENVITRFIRIYPQTWMVWPSFRIEIEGCPYRPASCWKAVLGTEGNSLPLIYQMTTSNHGFCGRACHRFPTCDCFKFSKSTNLCQLMGNITYVYPSTTYTDLSKKYYFAKNDVCP